MTFDCHFDDAAGRYSKYSVNAESEWAAASVSLAQNVEDTFLFPGFPDTESALVYLTHPLAGFYHRRDGKIGTYHVWHKRLEVQPASLISANFKLLSDLGIVTLSEQSKPYSVFIEPLNTFTIYLPPKVIN